MGKPSMNTNVTMWLIGEHVGPQVHPQQKGAVVKLNGMDWAGGDLHDQKNPSHGDAEKYVLANIAPYKPCGIIKSDYRSFTKDALKTNPPKKLDNVDTYIYGREIGRKN